MFSKAGRQPSKDVARMDKFTTAVVVLWILSCCSCSQSQAAAVQVGSVYSGEFRDPACINNSGGSKEALGGATAPPIAKSSASNSAPNKEKAIILVVKFVKLECNG